VSIIVAVLLAGWLIAYLMTFQVRVNERAIVFRFGKVSRTIDEPGLCVKWPRPIETYQTFDTRMQVFESKFSEHYTANGFSLVLTLAAGWSIEDPRAYYESQVAGDVRGQLEGLIGGELTAVVGRHDFDHFVSTTATTLRFDQIEEEILGKAEDEDSLVRTARDRYGIHIHFVRITQLGLPEKVTESVFKRMKAERKREADELRSEGKRDAEKIKAEAESTAETTLAKAEAEATKLRGEGDAAAAGAYKVFRKNEGLALFLNKLDAIRKLRDRLTVIIDTRTPPFDVLGGSIKDVLERHKKPMPPAPFEAPKPGSREGN
jgi:membrane protease subunit HflC